MITAQQLRMARAALSLTIAQLAKASGISATSIAAIERGGDFRSSTMRSIEASLRKQGAVFGADGSVKIVPKTEPAIWEPGQNPDATTKRAALAILNAGRRARGLPLIEDPDE